MYLLKETIGEAVINDVLKRLAERYGYAQPPYPTSHDLVDGLLAAAPAHAGLIRELFEEMVLYSNRTLAATAKKRADGKFDVTIEVESRRFQADDKGAEKETQAAGRIEIGAFAKPDKGKKYGRTLYRGQVAMTSGKSSHTFITAEMPDKAGIDPFLLLVDRVPDDNLKTVTQ